MVKKLGIGCGGLFLLLVLIGVATGGGSRTSPTPTSPPLSVATSQPAGAAPAAAKQWVVIKQFTGDGIKDTEQFTVGSEWRIDWDYTPPGSGGIFQIYIYDSGNSLVGLAANTQKAGPDTSFQHRAGTYYLKVNATGGWKVAVQENR